MTREHTPRPGATWETRLIHTETVIPDDAPDPRPDRKTRRAMARRMEEPVTELPSINARDVHGHCPACGNPTLRLAEDGHITCTLMDCPRPDLVSELIGEVSDARNHAAYTFCSQLVGHVSMTAFAKKITEKVTAVAQRKEAVEYANAQKERAERAEATNERARALHQPIDGEGGPYCQTCTQDEIQPQPVGWWVVYPCPTVVALDTPAKDAP